MKANKKTLGVLAAAVGFALGTMPAHAAGGRVHKKIATDRVRQTPRRLARNSVTAPYTAISVSPVK